MMRSENESISEINKKIKKYSVAAGSVLVIAAVMAAVAANSRSAVSERNETVSQTQQEQVEVKVTNEPDIRNDETLIIPVTELTTENAEPVTADADAGVTEEDTKRAAPTSYMLPLSTDIGLDYSCGVPVYNNIMSDWRTHDGVDFNGAYGDGVKAIAEGIVKDIKNDSLMGSTITVDHGGGIVAEYCGTSPTEDIIKGIIVSQGDMLGTLSEIPCEKDSDFPHLHLEIRKDGELCDPLELMGFYE